MRNYPEVIVLGTLFLLVITIIFSRSTELTRITGELATIAISGYFGYLNQQR